MPPLKAIVVLFYPRRGSSLTLLPCTSIRVSLIFNGAVAGQHWILRHGLDAALHMAVIILVILDPLEVLRVMLPSVPSLLVSIDPRLG